jgi:hypothetical protein
VPPERPGRRLPNSPFQAPPEQVVEQYAVGDRVAHDEHGLGSVVSTDPHGVSVDFGNGPVRIPSPFARMEKL